MTTPRYTVPDLDAAQRFVDRLRALPPEHWEAFARSLDPLRSDDIRTVWKRARRRSLFVAEFPVLRELFTLLATIGALVAELAEGDGREDPEATAKVVEHMRRKAQEAAPNHRAWVELNADLMEVAANALPGDRLASDTITFASMALMNRPSMRPRLFTEAYAPFEPFVPASTVSDVV